MYKHKVFQLGVRISVSILLFFSIESDKHTILLPNGNNDGCEYE